MDATSFVALVMACAPQVHTDTARAIVAVESGFNPLAIGVVGGVLQRQPKHRAEAIATARALQGAGWNFSAGLGQINVSNFARLGLTIDSVFEPCANLTALQTVLTECFDRAHAGSGDQVALRRALSCYYSGNFTNGIRHGYVGRVAAAVAAPTRPTVRTATQEVL